MQVLLAAFAIAGGFQHIVQDLPTPTYIEAFLPGQREVVFGPELLSEVTMEVRREQITPVEFSRNKVFGEGDAIWSIGYVKWSVTDGTLFNRPCRILKMEGVTRGEILTKWKRFEYATKGNVTYWITLDGKLLRQSVVKADPTTTKRAECVFWPDHIEVSVTDEKVRKSFAIYPKVDLSLLDMQFKPMYDGDKLVMKSKEFYVFEPFTQSFEKYKVIEGGTFHGSFLNMKFEGKHFDISGPRGTVKAYISKEGDLVKVDMPGSKENDIRTLVLNNIPRSRDPMYQKTAGASANKGN